MACHVKDRSLKKLLDKTLKDVRTASVYSQVVEGQIPPKQDQGVLWAEGSAVPLGRMRHTPELSGWGGKSFDDKWRSVDFYLQSLDLKKPSGDECNEAVLTLFLIEGDYASCSGKDGFVKGKVEESRAVRSHFCETWFYSKLRQWRWGWKRGSDLEEIFEVVMKAAFGQ